MKIEFLLFTLKHLSDLSNRLCKKTAAAQLVSGFISLFKKSSNMETLLLSVIGDDTSSSRYFNFLFASFLSFTSVIQLLLKKGCVKQARM